MGDTESRLLALEYRLYGLPIDAILARLAALEQGSWQQAGGFGVGSDSSAVVLKTTTLVGPLAGTAPGSGSGTLEMFDGTDLSDSTLTSLPVRNLTGKTFPSGVYLLAVPASGYYWVTSADPTGYVGISSTSIAARSGATVNSGTVTIQSRSGSALSSAGTSVAAWNITNKAVANGAYVIVAYASGDYWIVAVGDEL